jgi:hypothetical protein
LWRFVGLRNPYLVLWLDTLLVILDHRQLYTLDIRFHEHWLARSQSGVSLFNKAGRVMAASKPI